VSQPNAPLLADSSRHGRYRDGSIRVGRRGADIQEHVRLGDSDHTEPIRSRASILTCCLACSLLDRLLSGISITSLPTLHTALERLHSENSLQHVALSSIPLPASLVRSLDLPQPPLVYAQLLPTHTLPWYHSAEDSDPEDDILVCFASTKLSDGSLETTAFSLPTVQGYFSGVGDLFSAMVQAHYQPNPSSPATALVDAVSRALLAVQCVLLRTHLHSLSQALISGSATPRPLHPRKAESVIPTDNELDSATPHDPKDPKRKAKRMRLRELRVVQERHLLTSHQGWLGKRIDWSAT